MAVGRAGSGSRLWHDVIASLAPSERKIGQTPGGGAAAPAAVGAMQTEPGQLCHFRPHPAKPAPRATGNFSAKMPSDPAGQPRPPVRSPARPCTGCNLPSSPPASLHDSRESPAARPVCGTRCSEKIYGNVSSCVSFLSGTSLEDRPHSCASACLAMRSDPLGVSGPTSAPSHNAVYIPSRFTFSFSLCACSAPKPLLILHDLALCPPVPGPFGIRRRDRHLCSTGTRNATAAAARRRAGRRHPGG
jgi:hypothetical protein